MPRAYPGPPVQEDFGWATPHPRPKPTYVWNILRSIKILVPVDNLGPRGGKTQLFRSTGEKRYINRYVTAWKKLGTVRACDKPTATNIATILWPSHELSVQYNPHPRSMR